MSDKLVSLETVKRTLENAYYGEATLGELLETLDEISPVESQMSAVEYIHISNRMLKEDYRAWYKLITFAGNNNTDKAIAWMKEWAREHPEEVNNE